MAIARRRTSALDTIAAPMPTTPLVRPTAPELGVPVSPGDAPAPELGLPVGRLRRCTFRRIDQVTALPGRQGDSDYEFSCLYDDVDEPLGLGDVSSARPICDSCTASGIFRPDED
jgi:hypothetical protein